MPRRRRALRPRSPANATLPAVESTDVRNGISLCPPHHQMADHPQTYDMTRLPNGKVRFNARFTPFRHLAFFPEQAANWAWLDEAVRRETVARNNEPEPPEDVPLSVTVAVADAVVVPGTGICVALSV